MIRTITASICLVLLPVSFVGAGTINVDVGDYTFAPNTGVHTIDIKASSPDTGGVNVQGMELYVQLSGVSSTPEAFSGVDITGTDKLFSTNNTGAAVFPDFPNSAFAASTTTNSGTLNIGSSPVTIGTVSVETTGVAAGTYSLLLSDTMIGDTKFSGPGTIITSSPSGTITFGGEEIPEPASMLLMAGLMACGAPAVVAYRRRKRTATAC